MISDGLADFFLAFSQVKVVLFISLMGLLLIKRKLFFQATSLAAFSILVNVALKGTFKVPLPVEIGPGYAFPSGHMQFSTVFYLWLALHQPFCLLRALVAVLLIGIAAGLIHYGYHELYEVLGGFFAALLLITFYRYALTKFKPHTTWLLLATACILMAYNALVYLTIPSHAFPAFCAVWGFIITEKVFSLRCAGHGSSIDRGPN